MSKNEVYVAEIYIFDDDEHKETIAICRDLKTAYNAIKDEIAKRKKGRLKYCNEITWRRVSDTTLVKTFELADGDIWDMSYDFIITRWEVM